MTGSRHPRPPDPYLVGQHKPLAVAHSTIRANLPGRPVPARTKNKFTVIPKMTGQPSKGGELGGVEEVAGVAAKPPEFRNGGGEGPGASDGSHGPCPSEAFARQRSTCNAAAI
jgi:hypothetical protein